MFLEHVCHGNRSLLLRAVSVTAIDAVDVHTGLEVFYPVF
jgi:hypothetical protein